MAVCFAGRGSLGFAQKRARQLVVALTRVGKYGVFRMEVLL